MRVRGVIGILAVALALTGCVPSGQDLLMPTRTIDGMQARQYLPQVDILEFDFYADDDAVHTYVLLTSEDDYAPAAPLYVGVEYVSAKGRIIGSSTRIAEFQWVGQELAVAMRISEKDLAGTDVAGIIPTVEFSRLGRDPGSPQDPPLPAPLPVLDSEEIEQVTPYLHRAQFTFRNSTGTYVENLRATILCKDHAGDLVSVTAAYPEPVGPGGSTTFEPYLPTPVHPDSCTAYLAYPL